MPKRPLAALKKFGNKGAKEELVERENWARNQLMAAGSDLLGKFSNLQVLSLLILICFATSTWLKRTIIFWFIKGYIRNVWDFVQSNSRLDWRTNVQILLKEFLPTYYVVSQSEDYPWWSITIRCLDKPCRNFNSRNFTIPTFESFLTYYGLVFVLFSVIMPNSWKTKQQGV